MYVYVDLSIINFRLQYSTFFVRFYHDLYIFQDFLSDIMFMWKMFLVDPDKMIGMSFFLDVSFCVEVILSAFSSFEQSNDQHPYSVTVTNK